jgi:exodeoxyribonuclease V beta subunit
MERSRFSGTRFGNALHQALEHVDFAAWHDWRDALPPPEQFQPLREALDDFGFSSEADQEDGLLVLSAMIRETLNAPMPEGTRLAALPASARSAEMEFHLALSPAARAGGPADRQDRSCL